MYQAMATAGVRWARETQAFNRMFVHVGPNQFDWQAPDYYVNEAVRNQVQLIGLLWMTPGWDSLLPPTDPNYNFSAPRSYDQWGDYVFQTVNRFKDRVHYWEVWNEEDFSALWPGYWGGTPADYAHLLAVAYTEIRRADPTAKVLIGGSAAGVFADTLADESIGFFDRALTDPINPAAGNFDIMSVHVYGTPSQARSQMVAWWQFLSDRGLDNRPIWVTEFGWPSEGDDQQEDPDFCCGPDAQARFLQTFMPELVNVWGAEKVFWWTIWLANDPAWDRFLYYGLLDFSYQPTPAYYALRDLLRSTSPLSSSARARGAIHGVSARSWTPSAAALAATNRHRVEHYALPRSARIRARLSDRAWTTDPPSVAAK